MTYYEKALKMRPYMEKAVTSLSDADALNVTAMFPAWKVGKAYEANERYEYNGDLYRVITAHTSQADWTPDVAVSLYTRIDVVHDGSKEDPIPYNGNMTLVNGLYYTQDGVVYVCTRDTGNPVYHNLADLVGQYVEVAL